MKKLLFHLTIIILIILATDLAVAYKNYVASVNRAKQYFIERNLDINSEKIKSILPKFEYSLRLIPFKNYYKNFSKNFLTNPHRTAVGNDKNKFSIIVFGCSFADGIALEHNFSKQLSDLTGRTVYNRAFGGMGPATAVWQTKNKEFYQTLLPDYKSNPPEYVIWVYIPLQFDRIYFDRYAIYTPLIIGYNIKNSHLVENKSILLQLCRLNTVKSLIDKFIISKHFRTANDIFNENFDLLKIHFLETKYELQKRFPNIKFIILKFPVVNLNSNPRFKGFEQISRWKELEKDFIVYDLTKELNVNLLDEQYLIDDGHPNEKAWEIVTKKLVKDLNL